MWRPFCLTTSCKRTLASLSRYYTLCFCMKQHNFHFLIYSQPPVVCHFTNWWHLSHFPWTTAFTRTFATSIVWCYNFNGLIKWYDFSCATLYIILLDLWNSNHKGNKTLHVHSNIYSKEKIQLVSKMGTWPVKCNLQTSSYIPLLTKSFCYCHISQYGNHRNHYNA